MKYTLGCTLLVQHLFTSGPIGAQETTPRNDPPIPAIVAAVSADRIGADIATLVGFGTRHTLSDTLSPTRGIGAARRWVAFQFDSISAACGGCLDVQVVSEIFPPGERLPDSTNIVNLVAIQRGTSDTNRVVLMSGDIDSRISDPLNAIDSAPGANDNATGMAGVIEAARVLSRYRFPGTIVYAGLSGEEQGLYGGGTVARMAVANEWDVEAVLNNDMIGNIRGGNGVIDNGTARVFSDGTPPTETERERLRRRFTGGEVDGVSRQLARYVDRIADRYIPNLDVMLVYRLDRFGRGGHHRPFADLGFPAVRIMETNENYTRQHQDVRVEDGIAYGDVLDGIDPVYAARLTALNAATLASLASSPGAPRNVSICGAVRPHAWLRWDDPVDAGAVSGYTVYWRLTDSPAWDHSQWVGPVNRYDFEGLVIDNYFFGVAAVGESGNESVVVFPAAGRDCEM